jgi:hypothetical protein
MQRKFLVGLLIEILYLRMIGGQLETALGATPDNLEEVTEALLKLLWMTIGFSSGDLLPNQLWDHFYEFDKKGAGKSAEEAHGLIHTYLDEVEAMFREDSAATGRKLVVVPCPDRSKS